MNSLTEITEEIRSHSGCGFEPCETSTNAVPGAGSADADVMLIGEAPGKHEDLQGLPFVGAAGKLLAEMLESIQLARESVYITNVLKHRPPGNRDPRPDEVLHEWPWLEAQVKVIQPKLIVLLGRHAMDRFLPNMRIGADHGRAKRFRGQVYYPVYHPAAALYNGSLRQTLFDDFAQIPKLLEQIDVPVPSDVEIEPANVDKSEASNPQPVSKSKTNTKTNESAQPKERQQQLF